MIILFFKKDDVIAQKTRHIRKILENTKALSTRKKGEGKASDNR